MKDHYKGLRNALIALLSELEIVKKKCQHACELSQAIGGPVQKEMVSLAGKFDQIAKSILKLEQETREI